jgi:hypothetical protein
LQPERAYLHLFNAIVLDVWNHRETDTKRLRAELEAVVRAKRERLDRIVEVFLNRAIDLATYERQGDRVREKLALAEIDLSEAVVSQLDIEGILAFAEHLLTGAARLWLKLGSDQKQQLQRVLFPNAITFDGEKFGTAVTCLAFKQLNGSGTPKSQVASQVGFERSRRPLNRVFRAA